jgi:hypothetical protein
MRQIGLLLALLILAMFDVLGATTLNARPSPAACDRYARNYSHNYSRNGQVVGDAGRGALMGAGIGAISGRAGRGAAIGAGVGAVAGGLDVPPARQIFTKAHTTTVARAASTFDESAPK